MIAGVIIAFHMYKDDCPTVLMFFQHCYPTIILEYTAVACGPPILSMFCAKNIVNMSVILMIEAVKVDSWC